MMTDQAHKSVMDSGMAAFLNEKISADNKLSAVAKLNINGNNNNNNNGNNNNNNNNSTTNGSNNNRGRQSKKQKIEIPNKDAVVASFQASSCEYDETDEKLSKRSRLDLSSLVDNSAYLPNGASSVDFLKVNTETSGNKKQRRNSKQINSASQKNNANLTVEEDNDTNSSVLNKSLPILETAKIQPEVCIENKNFFLTR